MKLETSALHRSGTSVGFVCLGLCFFCRSVEILLAEWPPPASLFSDSFCLVFGCFLADLAAPWTLGYLDLLWHNGARWGTHGKRSTGRRCLFSIGKGLPCSAAVRTHLATSRTTTATAATAVAKRRNRKTTSEPRAEWKTAHPPLLGSPDWKAARIRRKKRTHSWSEFRDMFVSSIKRNWESGMWKRQRASIRKQNVVGRNGSYRVSKLIHLGFLFGALCVYRSVLEKPMKWQHNAEGTAGNRIRLSGDIMNQPVKRVVIVS